MGHLGAPRVVQLARERFYWLNMEDDITHFVTKVCPCLKQRQPNLSTRAPLHRVTTSYPFAVFSPGRGLAGFPQKNLRWRTKSQEDAPVRAQDQASSQTDLRMFEYFNGQSNTPAFCLFK